MSYNGPYPLTSAAIDNMVKKGSPGTYLIGRMDGQNFIYVKVGRDDVCVNTRLHSYVGDHEFERWQWFKFQLFNTPRAAFEEESRVFHQGPGPKNLIHPARPNYTNFPCPVSEECFKK